MTPTTVDMTGQAAAPNNKQQDTTVGGEVSAATEATKPAQEAVDPKLAAFARREKQFRQQQRAFEAERRAFEEQRQKAQAPQGPDWKSKIQSDFWGTMTEAGYTPDQITQMMLNQPGPQDLALQNTQRTIQELQKKIEQLESGHKQSQDQGREAARKQILHDVSTIVSADPSFEAINQYGNGAKRAVVELIEKTFDEEGYIMDTEAAIKEVEDYLVEEAYKAAQLKKVQSKFAPPPAPPAAEAQQKQAAQPASQKPQMNTLSNRMVPSTTKPLSDRERRERAIAAFQGRQIT